METWETVKALAQYKTDTSKPWIVFTYILSTDPSRDPLGYLYVIGSYASESLANSAIETLVEKTGYGFFAITRVCNFAPIQRKTYRSTPIFVDKDGSLMSMCKEQDALRVQAEKRRSIQVKLMAQLEAAKPDLVAAARKHRSLESIKRQIASLIDSKDALVAELPNSTTEVADTIDEISKILGDDMDSKACGLRR